MLIPETVINCVAIVAGVCVNEPAKVNIVQSGTWTGVTLRIRGVRVSSEFSADSVSYPGPKTMTKLCQSGECLFYRGECRRSRQRINCSLWYSYNEEIPLRKIELAGGLHRMPAALRSLKLIRSSNVSIPLSRFNFINLK
jgi:hypothetical protein